MTGSKSACYRTEREGVTVGLRPAWRAHSCMPRSHSCERPELDEKGVRKSANTTRRPSAKRNVHRTAGLILHGNDQGYTVSGCQP